MANFSGTDGHDTYPGTPQADTIRGLGGNDQLSGAGGNDLIDGGSGADRLEGGDGDDVLSSFFDRFLDPNAERDLLFGNDGNDSVWAGANDDADGGTGSDTLYLSLAGGSAGASVNIADLVAGAPVTILNGVIQNFEAVGVLVGTAFNDTLTATTQALRLTLDGGEGNDQLTGAGSGIDFITGTGDDTVQGSSQDDTVDAAAGTKTVFGNGGNDTFIVRTLQTGLPPSTYDGGEGVDTLNYRAVMQGVRFESSAADPTLITAGGNTVTNVEVFKSGGGSDVFDFSFYGSAVTVEANGGDDSFVGSAGADVFSGGDGNDTAKIDVEDSVDMGDGQDTIWLPVVSRTTASVTTIIGGAGQDIVRFGTGVTANMVLGQATAGNATFVLSGIEGIQVAVRDGIGSTITGGGYLSVDALNDDGSAGVRFEGRGLEDRFVGGRGDDQFLGGAGTNDIDGGGGVDTANYTGTRDQYTVREYQGVIQVYDGRSVLDNLHNVEWLQFSDQRIYIGHSTFETGTNLAYRSFGYSIEAGGWSSDGLYPRTAADINGDGKADLVGFGSNGVYTALATGNGSFGPLELAYASFGQADEAGGWSTDDRFPRTLADVNGDGMADLLGFGDAGVFVALATGEGNFGPLALTYGSFGYSIDAGGWSSNGLYPRMAADINGDGMADLVGFGSNGVYTALATGNGQFAPLVLSYPYFGQAQESGGWYTDDRNPRMLGDVNGDGMADIVGFGRAGVYVALATGDGNFGTANLVLGRFGEDEAAGGWTSNALYPRLVADVNGDGMADIVGFGSAGVHVAFATGGGLFEAPTIELESFGRDPQAGGWTDNDHFPRVLADVNGDGTADILGFGDAGVYLTLALDVLGSPT